VTRARADLRLSYVPQRASVDELYPLLAGDVVELGRQRGWSFLRRRGGRLSEASRGALERMGAADLVASPYRNLSEGQKQRVLLARLAASDAEVAFLDEPTSAMDVVAEREAFVLLDALRRERGITVLVVSHTMGVVREHAERALFFDRDTVVTATPAHVLRHQTFVARYGELEG
jgi:zinc transport system ATP-binding protein